MKVLRDGVVKRDLFGVHPLFYARVSGGVVHSESLEEVLAHPEVRFDELDERAVGDYLANGVCGDAAATVFAHVRRVPPAHALTVRNGEAEISRYWSLPSPKVSRDAPAQLEAALRASIREKLTASKAVIFMSGGLDSTTLAALAREVAPDVELLAQTSVYRTRMLSEEEFFAREAARSMGINIRVVPLDEYTPLQALEEKWWTADPGALLTAPASRALHAAAVKHAPLAMHGHPADAILAADLTSHLRSLGFLERIAALVRYTIAIRRPPYFFFRELLQGREWQPDPLPSWLLARPHLRVETHPLESPIWSSYFEWAHPSTTRTPLEVVYPWFDERVIEAAMAMPPIPWLVEKHVLRRLLHGRVSDTVRLRKKSWLQGDPWRVELPVPHSLEIEAAARYIDPQRFRAALSGARSLSNTTLRAIAFEYWLRELPQRIKTGPGLIRA
jgi:asparagine synthase (glutamine-hydrolysing)